MPPAPDPNRFEDTLAGAKEGDVAATNLLFEQFYPTVKRMVHHSLSTDLRRSRPWLAARFSTGDVVQEVFRSVLEDLSGFAGRNERAFAGYLMMLVRNRIVDAIRFHEAERRDGRRGAPPVAEEETPSAHNGPVAAITENEALQRFHAALADFPDREQLLLRARFEGIASFAELTERLGYSSESAARRAYFSAQAKLSVRLRPQDETGVDA